MKRATGTKRQARGLIARGTPHRLIAGATRGGATQNGIAAAAPAPARAARGVALSEAGELAIADFRRRVSGMFYGGREVLVIGAGVYDSGGEGFTPAESPCGVFSDVVILRPGVTIETALDRLGEFIKTIAVDGPRDNAPDAIGFTS